LATGTIAISLYHIRASVPQKNFHNCDAPPDSENHQPCRVLRTSIYSLPPPALFPQKPAFSKKTLPCGWAEAEDINSAQRTGALTVHPHKNPLENFKKLSNRSPIPTEGRFAAGLFRSAGAGIAPIDL
jgi:hypothetical protein